MGLAAVLGFRRRGYLILAAVFALGLAGSRLFDPARERSLVLELRSDVAGTAKVYYDLGAGLRESDSVSAPVPAGRAWSTLRFPLPARSIRVVRFDPFDDAGDFAVRWARVEDGAGNVLRRFPPEALVAQHQIATRTPRSGAAVAFSSEPDANDPYLMIAGSDLPATEAGGFLGSPPTVREVGASFIATALAALVAMGARRLAGRSRAPGDARKDRGLAAAAAWLASRSDLAFGLLACAAIVTAVFPGFVTLARWPMATDGWALQDPVVSVMTFVPGREVIRHEALHHANLLWSNLRGMGLPLLGNDVQAAPLFPLTLLLLPIPNPYYWNVLVVTRLVLLGLAGFLLGRRALRLGRTASVIFALGLAYGLHVLRWLNHPWQNGYLAGLFYLYFVLRMLDAPEARGRWTAARARNVLGLALCAYGLATCGFPEASAMSLLLAALVVPSFALAAFRTGPLRTTWPRVAIDLVAANLIGGAMASPQILALAEFVALAPSGFRKDFGLYQYSGFAAVEGWLTPFSDGPPPGSLIHLFGLIPAFLALVGAASRLASPRRLDRRDAAALACLAFFVLKNFPIWAAFNRAVGSLPILRASWFVVYFLPILLWAIAFYAAEGMEWLLGARRGRVPLAFGAAAVLLVGTGLLARDLGQEPYWKLVAGGSPPVAALFGLFIAFWLVAVMGARLSTAPRAGALQRGALLALAVAELMVMQPDRFHRMNAPGDPGGTEAGDRVVALARDHGTRPELRIGEPNGLFAVSGLATPDNGAMAILQRRLQTLRNELFVVPWRGYLPLRSAKFPYSWDLVSTNLFLGSDQAEVSARYGCETCQPLGEIGPNANLYWNPEALPRAYLPSSCAPSLGPSQSMAFLMRTQEFEPGDVFLETSDPAERRVCDDYDLDAPVPVSIVEDAGSVVRLRELRGPAIVVLNDNVYPGWRATDERSGDDLAIRPANVSFRAVVLREPRPYQIVFRYRPGWLWPALGLVTLGGAGMLALAIAAARAPRV